MDQSQLKIVFTGSVGAGKSTSIKAISDIDPFQTEENATDETLLFKNKTTVGMDYGRINIDKKTTVHLYGTPGQERFSFMWEIIGTGALGIIILIKNSSDNPLGQLDTYLRAFAPHLQTRGIVVGITYTDVCNTPNISEYRTFLRQAHHSTIPLYTFDARNSDMIRMLVKTLIYRIDPTLK